MQNLLIYFNVIVLRYKIVLYLCCCYFKCLHMYQDIIVDFVVCDVVVDAIIDC